VALEAVVWAVPEDEVDPLVGAPTAVVPPVPDVTAPVPDVTAPVPDVTAPVPDVTAPLPDVVPLAGPGVSPAAATACGLAPAAGRDGSVTSM
jgi:hypothetical protein